MMFVIIVEIWWMSEDGDFNSSVDMVDERGCF